MDNIEKRFRGRIVPKGEGLEERPRVDNAEQDREELMRQLGETKKTLEGSDLSADRAHELWERQKELEKKLGLDDGNKKDPTTGVYL